MSPEDFLQYVLLFALGIIVALVISTVFPLSFQTEPVFDITTNVTSVSINSDGGAVLNTEVGDFRFVGRRTSPDVDFIISNLIPKCEPLILHFENGYVRSYKRVYSNMKGC